MADPDFQREVTRSGGTVRVDLTEAANVSEADTDAIVATAKGSSPEDEVRVVQIDGRRWREVKLRMVCRPQSGP